MDFTTKTTKIGIYGLKEYLSIHKPEDEARDWASRGEVVIDYTANITSASWGISSISTCVTKVSGVIELWKGEEYEKEFEEIKILIDKDWKIIDDIKPSTNGGELLLISEVEVDINKKEISIS